MALTLRMALASRGYSAQDHRQLLEVAVAAGAGLIVIIVAVAAMGSFARRVSRDVSALEAVARRIADEELPLAAQRLRQSERGELGQRGEPGQRGESTAGTDPGTQQPHPGTVEVARAAAAIASLQLAAVGAASGEASMRHGIRQVFVSLARRNQSLLQRQLRLIDELEQKAPDPAALADLFPLDHLTTRMRRHAESLIILSGATPGRSWSDPVPVVDVIRGAVAEVEDYRRVRAITKAEDAVVGSAVADLTHLLAELIENATLFSPSHTQVEVRAELVANGFAIEIDDRGLGLKPDQLSDLNQQLATPLDFDLANADRLGLFVVGRLAARHGVRVSLRTSPYGGTTAIVLMPSSLVVPAAEAGAGLVPRSAVGMRPRLELWRASGGLALAAARSVQPAPAAQSALPVLPVQSALPAPSARHAASADSAASAQPVPTARPARQAAGSYRGLPLRVRQASLSPHLRESVAATRSSPGAGPLPAPVGLRTPEQARDLMTSLQSGWRRGRLGDSAPEAGQGPAELADPAGLQEAAGQAGSAGRLGTDQRQDEEP